MWGQSGGEMQADAFPSLSREGGAGSELMQPEGGSPPNYAGQLPQQQPPQQGPPDMGYGHPPPDGSCSNAGMGYVPSCGDMGYGGGAPSGWNPHLGAIGDQDNDYADGRAQMPQAMIEGPSIVMPALSFRQPFASLVLYGIKSIEARNKPTLKQMQGTLALHVSDTEEPWNSPLLSAAVSLLRRRYNDETIVSFFQLPQTMSQGHGSIVGIVEVECTWHADLFNEVEQHQLTEQAVYPVQGAWVTQLRNPRWLKYPVQTPGSNRLWQVQIPIDALPDGTEVDRNGNLVCLATRDAPPLYQPGSCAPLMEGDDMGMGLLGGDMLRQLGSEVDAQSEAEKKRKKLQKALRQIGELKEKLAAGVKLEKTQEGKISREAELLAELAELDKIEGGDDLPLGL